MTVQPRAETDVAIERTVVLFLVAAAHAILVLLILITQNRPREVVIDETVPVWLHLEPPIQRPVSPLTTTQPFPGATAHRGRESIVESQQATGTDPAAKPETPIDWNVQGAYYAKKTVEDGLNRRYRNLGVRRPAPSEELQAPV